MRHHPTERYYDSFETGVNDYITATETGGGGDEDGNGVLIECGDCGWKDRVEPTGDVPYYCPGCGDGNPEPVTESIDLSEEETKSDKV